MKSNFIIMTDTTAEVSRALQERFHIDEIVKAHVGLPDGSDHVSDNDWELFPDPDDFYRQLSDKKLEFSTSPANVEEIKAAVRAWFEKGEDVMFLSLSSALSGAYNFVLLAKKDLVVEFPERKLVVIDTQRYSLAIALLCVEAAKKRDEGLSIFETAEYIEKIKNTLHEAGPMDDLFFLARKGRVAKGAAVMGTLVGVKPLGDFNRDGKTQVLAKVLGLKNALRVSVDYIKRTIINPEEQIIFVAHTDREKNALLLKEKIENEIHPKEVILVECGPSIAINVGPGLYAAFYFGTEISPDCSAERGIMKDLTRKNKQN